MKWNRKNVLSTRQLIVCHEESCELSCISLEQQFAAFDGFFVRNTTTKTAHNSSLLSGEWCRWNEATVGRIWRVSAVAVIINAVHGHEFNHIITSESREKQWANFGEVRTSWNVTRENEKKRINSMIVCRWSEVKVKMGRNVVFLPFFFIKIME